MKLISGRLGRFVAVQHPPLSIFNSDTICCALYLHSLVYSLQTPLAKFSCFFRCIPSQGEALIPGERAEAMERFTPADGSGVVFIKLSDGRGYVSIRSQVGLLVIYVSLSLSLLERGTYSATSFPNAKNEPLVRDGGFDRPNSHILSRLTTVSR